MSNQNLEALVSTLSAQVVQQGHQIVELQKQLADMQKATSCELDDIRETRNKIFSSALEQSDYAAARLDQLFIKEAVIKSDNFHLNSNGNSVFSLTHGANVKNNKETEAMKVSLIIENDGDAHVVSELNMCSKSTDTNLFLSKVYASLHELELHQQKSTPSADAILSHLSDELTARGF
ncbi:hypothetical protein QN092_08170 [Proteus vulgaris]|uniref:hypothetical protein n=1 Tax=Proteus vulgaris TaxID=585 RepID=UPI00254184B8|nr:hypothetical protein [Proteus vulgaris]WIF73837.1 hypothetical protein QN092_08170 [Proteus vulgaris]